jgi:hypothetical protein
MDCDMRRSKTHLASPLVPYVAEAATYTLYERGPVWYVSFSTPERSQIRVATGCTDRETAQALVESYRRGVSDLPAIKINPVQIRRVLERARYRSGRKEIPFDLTEESVKLLFDNCKGYCQVTGHAMQGSGPFRPSLDRIEPSKGYVNGNVRVVCLITNTGMLHYGEQAFSEIAIAYCRTAGLIPLLSATYPAC